MYELYVIIDETLAEGRFEQVAEEVIRGGVKAIQIRCKRMSDKALLSISEKLREITCSSSTKLIINDRVDICLAVNADGVHLGQEDFPPKTARKLLGDKIIGVSVHTIEEALKASDDGVDYISVGPLFPTKTKLNAGAPVGVNLISRIKRCVQIPTIGIGGIDLENVIEVIRAGADGVAVCSFILRAQNITSTVERMVRRIFQEKKKR
jgi:thiamine-phosphate pyrophosphorylase